MKQFKKKKKLILQATPIFFLIAGLIFYSFLIEPKMLQVVNYSIKDSSLSGIKLVLIGDLHLKPNEEERLYKIVNKINLQNPDVVLSVGDFVNGHSEKSTLPIDKIANELKKIKSKNGFYTVLGNHDIWINEDEITSRFEQSGIKVLKNENIPVKIKDKNLYIAGVEDLTTKIPDVDKALNDVKSPTILLTHNPDIFPEIPQNVNLTLSGHLHGGQVRLPFSGAVVTPSRYGDRYSKGLIVENNKKLIATKGLGTSILPLRFNCVPEIVVIEFL